jgi:hypothetical protein
MKMDVTLVEAVSSSETSVSIYQSTLCYIPEVSHLQSFTLCGSLSSGFFMLCSHLGGSHSFRGVYEVRLRTLLCVAAPSIGCSIMLIPLTSSSSHLNSLTLHPPTSPYYQLYQLFQKHVVSLYRNT